MMTSQQMQYRLLMMIRILI